MKELFTKIIENNYLGGQMLQLFIHNIIGSIYSSNKTIFSSKQELPGIQEVFKRTTSTNTITTTTSNTTATTIIAMCNLLYISRK